MFLKECIHEILLLFKTKIFFKKKIQIVRNRFFRLKWMKSFFGPNIKISVPKCSLWIIFCWCKRIPNNDEAWVIGLSLSKWRQECKLRHFLACKLRHPFFSFYSHCMVVWHLEMPWKHFLKWLNIVFVNFVVIFWILMNIKTPKRSFFCQYLLWIYRRFEYCIHSFSRPKNKNKIWLQ